MYLATLIDKGNRKGKTTSTLCIDIKGAFDNVFTECLLHTMNTMKLDQKTTRWVETFLSFDKESEKMSPIDTGIPQGARFLLFYFCFICLLCLK